MGKMVMSNNYGQQSTGYHTYEVNTSNLTMECIFSRENR